MGKKNDFLFRLLEKNKSESHIERGVNATSRPFLETWFDIEFDQVHFKDCMKTKSAHGIHLSQVNMENSLYCFARSQQRPLLLSSKRNHFIIWGRFECFKTVKLLHQVVSYLRPQYRLQISNRPTCKTTNSYQSRVEGTTFMSVVQTKWSPFTHFKTPSHCTWLILMCKPHTLTDAASCPVVCRLHPTSSTLK